MRRIRRVLLAVVTALLMAAAPAIPALAQGREGGGGTAFECPESGSFVAGGRGRGSSGGGEGGGGAEADDCDGVTFDQGGEGGTPSSQ